MTHTHSISHWQMCSVPLIFSAWVWRSFRRCWFHRNLALSAVTRWWGFSFWVMWCVTAPHPEPHLSVCRPCSRSSRSVCSSADAFFIFFIFFICLHWELLFLRLHQPALLRVATVSVMDWSRAMVRNNKANGDNEPQMFGLKIDQLPMKHAKLILTKTSGNKMYKR